MAAQTREDDCEIYCLLGREVLGWDETPPDISQFPIFYRPDGDGYVEQCPWARLGVTPLPPGQPDMDHMRFFTAPRYDDQGTTASVSFVTRLVARDGRGAKRAPYIDQLDLTLTKVAGRWELTARKRGPVT